MTQKIYQTDAYAKECEANIIKVEGKFAYLDKTIFYPQGGGQPSDTGKIIDEKGNEYKVIFAKNSGEDIILELDKEGISEGKAKCILDWDRRYKLMKMHTSAHIISAIINQKFEALITGNQLGEQESRMDFNAKKIDKETIEKIEEEANQIIASNMEIKISFESKEKAMQRPEIFKLKDVLPKNIPIFRIVSIGNFDSQADGGTHVKNTKEIGKIKITNFKNKGAENRRIYWQLT
jgi:misacylated tRNA(Ala) deacylase